MSLSLREQLLQAGLGTKKQAKDAEREQRQARNKEAQAQRQRDEQKRAAEAQAAKAARDQELNRRRQEEAERRARWAQIRQLIEQHRLPRIEGDDYIVFNFIDRQKVRRLAVDAPRREKLMNGQLMIVRCEGRYDVVPPDVAARIAEREPRAVVSLQSESTAAAAEDDPYKDFVVPDDLMW